MKKRSLFTLIAGTLLISAGLVSCDEPVEGGKTNTLKVEPSESISFAASGNEDVVIKVTTDADEWKFTKPEWVTATKSADGTTLTVNAQNNTTEGTRAGRMEFTAGTAKAVVVNVTQAKPVPGGVNTLSVEPSDNIAFEATGNADIALTVTTDAEEWDFIKPDWVTAQKEGNKLTLNAEDNNTDASRAGRVMVTAGTAKPVTINVSQKKVGGDEPEPGPDPDAVAGELTDKDSGAREANFEIDGTEPIVANLSFALAAASGKDAVVEIFLDNEYLNEYNFINKANCELFPESLVTLAQAGEVTIPAGSLVSGDIAVTFEVDSDLIAYNTSYLVPLCVKPKSTNVTVAGDVSRVNYVFKRKNRKEVRNVLYYEVNDTNPLNALEYVLEDGQMFFDAIVLFAANINYNGDEDRVYLHNNPNVQALLDESDVYLQPLREKGIKVYLGLLGNHDAAGICQLSDWGAQQYAQELANAVDHYKLDGISFDDEYSGSPISGNKWFTSWSTAAGSRLCYETKRAMREVCGEDKDVMVFYWGGLTSSLPAIDGNQPGTFVDLAVANYGGAARPVEGMTLKGCSGASIELNLYRGSITEDSARRIKDSGYGWVMWFAHDPSPSSGIYNGERSLGMFKEAARGLYDLELREPQYYYKKIGEGVYDPKPYAF